MRLRCRSGVAIGAVVVAFSASSAAASARAPGAGAWSIVATPSPSDQANYLSSALALSAGDAWAVGAWYRPLGTPGTLTMHWNGSSWSAVRSPNATAGYNELYGVDGVATDDVWAVGYHNISAYGSERTMALHWNGAAWSIVQTPDIGRHASFLYDVSARSANDVWAVGEGNSATIDSGVTMVQHWDGSKWRLVRSPNVGHGANTLYGVAALASNDVWAVGESSARGALILHFDGTSWSVVPNDPPIADSALLAVVPVGPQDVWAVGYAGDRTLTERWDGSTWSVVTSPNGVQPSSVLSDVAVSGGAIWAVGSTYDPLAVTSRTLTERWNGSSWTVVASPSPSGQYDVLEGLAAGRGGVWAVGASERLTLALRGP